jgi:ComF family protein
MGTIVHFFEGFFFEKDPSVDALEQMDSDMLRKKADPAPLIKRHFFGKKEGDTTEICAVFSYQHPLIKTLVWNMKFRRNKRCFTLAGSVLYEELIDIVSETSQVSDFMCPLLLPVPLSATRRRMRGYNQTMLLAKEIIRLDAQKCFELAPEGTVLKYSRRPQTSLSRTERMTNLKGCFEVRGNVAGRNIILLDDVITTGTTMRELSSALAHAGARRILCIALAH